jgi:hypothetical protein
MKVSFVDRETLDRTWRGIDFGSDLAVLIRFNDRLVVWQRGHKFWGGNHRPQSYAPAELVVLNPATKQYGSPYVDLHKGRMSNEVGTQLGPRLAEELGLPKSEAAFLSNALAVARAEKKTAVVAPLVL